MAELRLDAAKTALVMIDLQKGIVGMPLEPRSGPDVIRTAARLADAFRAKGAFIVPVRVQTSADSKDGLQPDCDEPFQGGKRPDDWAELLPEIGPKPKDHVVTKKQWGAFYGTDLELQLRRRGLDTIVLCGIATCFGVESTARDAYELGFRQVFVEDAMSSRSAAEHEHTITRILPRIGRVRTAEQVLRALA